MQWNLWDFDKEILRNIKRKPFQGNYWLYWQNFNLLINETVKQLGNKIEVLHKTAQSANINHVINN